MTFSCSNTDSNTDERELKIINFIKNKCNVDQKDIFSITFTLELECEQGIKVDYDIYSGSVIVSQDKIILERFERVKDLKNFFDAKQVSRFKEIIDQIDNHFGLIGPRV